MSISQLLIAEFKHEAETTRSVLEVVPEDKLDFKPHEKSMTLGRLAGHVAENPGWVASMLETELDLANAGDVFQPFTATSRAQLLEKFDQQAASFTKTLEGKSDEELMAKWTLRQGEHVVTTLPRAAAIRGFVLNHTIHHRGQLSVYLRLLDVPLPPIYGPTADSPEFS